MQAIGDSFRNKEDKDLVQKKTNTKLKPIITNSDGAFN